MSSAIQTVNLEQLAGLNLPYDVDVSASTVVGWNPTMAIQASALISPTSPNETGFVYQASAAGQTGLLEPAWPTTAGQTVLDGSITWTAIAPPAAGEDAISSVTWTQISPPDAALTIMLETNTTRVATAFIGAGTSGNVYTINVRLTMTSGAIYGTNLVVTIV